MQIPVPHQVRYQLKQLDQIEAMDAKLNSLERASADGLLHAADWLEKIEASDSCR
jgi:hypothetical protein